VLSGDDLQCVYVFHESFKLSDVIHVVRFAGMGELHLDIIQDRIKSEFKVDADLGKLQVAYKETISAPVTKRMVFERRLADQKNLVTVELELIPKQLSNPTVKLYRGPNKEKQENLRHVSERLLKSIQNGVESGFRYGPKLGFPVSFFNLHKQQDKTVL
jgi:elongation factor G